jgi:Na+/H+ antiporter NhaD/arsenite permease-like protein
MNDSPYAASEVSSLLLLPLPVLLALIAVMPLTPTRLKSGWDRWYPAAALGLAGIVATYYYFNIPGGALALARTSEDYLSFISLIGSLFVVAGGIHLRVKGEATPLTNIIFLALGALAANVIGTTGASMVLIRPWLRLNQHRLSAYHVVFFIFIVSNIGGALTPVGDPPLFIGYLRGVPFFWLVPRVILPWLVTIAALLAVFSIFDRRSFHRMPRRRQNEVSAASETWGFDGAINLFFLLVIVGAVFLPSRWFVREMVMLIAAVASYALTPKIVHQENRFSFHPIREVALLFAGIFFTMLPAIEFLHYHGPRLGFTRPTQYYFGSGVLSAVLDNAPTYANFFALASATAAAEAPGAFTAAPTGLTAQTTVLLLEKPLFIVAVSLSSVFFGGMTYIGNGPNFMVKSIAEQADAPSPSFVGYIFKYSLPILLPILMLVGWAFL